MFWVTNRIMQVAPIGVFALIGLTVSKFGAASLLPLGSSSSSCTCDGPLRSPCLYGYCALARVRLLAIVRFHQGRLILAFSTATVETVLAVSSKDGSARVPTGSPASLFDGLFVQSRWEHAIPVDRRALHRAAIRYSSRIRRNSSWCSRLRLRARASRLPAQASSCLRHWMLAARRRLGVRRRRRQYWTCGAAVNVCGNSLLQRHDASEGIERTIHGRTRPSGNPSRTKQ